MAGKRKKKKGIQMWKKVLLSLAALALLSLVLIGYNYYERIYAPEVTADKNGRYFYIPTGTDYNRMLALLQAGHVVNSIEDFDWVARKMNLENNVHPGKYRLENGMSNYSLAALLRSGKQEPVKLVINKFRLKKDLAGFVSHKLEVDSFTLINALNDSIYLRSLGLKKEEALALFIPNTYLFYWNTSAPKFLERMKAESDKFWTPQRRQDAAAEKLSPAQVITLASIVEEETNYAPDKPLIASVYLNRLRSNMMLQADPTVKFAMQDFALTRILSVHLNFDSPYNTYRNLGLPPGPICTPSIGSIDAVLNAPRTDYFYFCANPNQSGTSVFAKTFQQHQLNARRYQHWLNGLPK